MRGAASLLAAALVVTAVGCASASTSNHVARDLAALAPGCATERADSIVMGRTTLALVRDLVRLADDEVDPEVREILRCVRRIEATTYRLSPSCELVVTALPLLARLAAEGWQAVVSSGSADDDADWVFTRADADGSVEGLLVISVERDELEVVRLAGDIDSVLAAAIAERPVSARGMRGPDR